MKTVRTVHKVEIFKSKLMEQYFSNMRMGVFDIETLGLSPEKSPLVLAGLLTVDQEGNALISQYFAEKRQDEALIMDQLRRDFENIDFLVTYNGKIFDLPFLEKRAYKLYLPPFHYNFYNLDLYMMIKSYSEIGLLLKNIKQKTVEEYMGLSDSRKDSISGAESVELYLEYKKCQEQSLKEKLEKKILLHNHDDLLQLYKLLPIVKQLDFHRALNSIGFPVAGENGWPYLNISRAKATNKEFEIRGKYYGPEFSYVSYDTFYNYYSCEFEDDGNFVFKIPVERHKRNSFINLRLYFNDFSDLEKYPCCVNDFLLVTRGLEGCYLESNMFAQKFLRKFMNDNVCPVNVL